MSRPSRKIIAREITGEEETPKRVFRCRVCGGPLHVQRTVQDDEKGRILRVRQCHVCIAAGRPKEAHQLLTYERPAGAPPLDPRRRPLSDYVEPAG